MALAVPAMRMASSSLFLPRLLPAGLFSTTRMQLYVRRFSLPLFPSLAVAIPAGFQLGLPSIPSLLEGIWESILKAVPKKKTSHSKKRHRQMAGKALKDVTSLCRCPACGEIKRMHYLCPSCTSSEEHRGSWQSNLHANAVHRTQGLDERRGQGEKGLKQCPGSLSLSKVRRGPAERDDTQGWAQCLPGTTLPIPLQIDERAGLGVHIL